MRWMRVLQQGASVLLAAALVACGTTQAAPDLAPSSGPNSSSSQSAPQAPPAAPPQAAAPAPAAPAPAPAVRALTATTVQVPAQFRQGAFSQDRQLQLAEGFSISVFALVPNARSLTLAPWGEILVSLPTQGRITGLRDADGDGVAETQRTVLSGLQCPYGMAFKDDYLYVAESSRVDRFKHNNGEAFGPAEQVVGDFPQSGCGAHHFRPLTFDWSGAFYVAFGSSCNVCVEPDDRRGSVWRYTLDGGAAEYARGLRNVVDLTVRPETGEVWVATNERDELGDAVPPEPITAISPGQNYGWPFCYWNGSAWAVDRRVPARNPGCTGLTEYYGLQAHSAPLGIAFYSQNSFPADLNGSGFVAMHGSWNHSQGVGFKLVRIPFADGAPQPAQDFVSGWMTGRPQDAWGRPVDVQEGADGALYLSDDRAGAVYRIAYTN
jgi:glucose/arabinose dehydrogenase